MEAGDRIGRFEVVAPLGAGAMGEVLRARDPELDREVAIKVLPEAVGADEDRRRRFEREARAIGRLDHPNLLSIHDVGSHHGRPFLVCELLEGETLAARLAAGRPALESAVDWSRQVAAGLAAAHDAGVVHRDIKPANLFLTRDGRVKILDFGLAKSVPTGEEGESTLPTVTAVTRQGALLGTVAYMAPEQAAGREIDHRADQFALGVVLYEMLTGVRPFRAETAAETLAAILRGTPEPLERHCDDVPAPLRWILERCLRREPGERYASTRDLEMDLGAVEVRSEELYGGGSRDGGADRGGARPGRPGWLLTAGLLAGLLGGIGLALLFGGRSSGGGESVEFERLTFREGSITAARFDPAGQGFFYSAAWHGGADRIYLQRSGSLDPLVFGPPDSRLLSVSPTGELLLLIDTRPAGPFHVVGTLARLPVNGAPRVLGRDVSDAVLDEQGELAALVREEHGLAILEFPPGRERQRSSGMILHMDLSPDGERLVVLETENRGHDRGAVVVYERESEETVRLGDGIGWGLTWSPGGDEIWFADFSSVSAFSLDGARRRLASFPTLVYLFDASRDGELLLALEDRRWETLGGPVGGAARDLTWRSWSVPFDLSDDGERVLLNECTRFPFPCQIGLRGFDGEPPVDFGVGFGTDLSSDGKWIASIPIWNPGELELVATDLGERREFSLELERIGMARFSQDGRTLLLNANRVGEANRIFRFDPESGALEPLTPEGIEFGFFAESPDQRRLAVPLPEGFLVLQPAGEAERWAETVIELDEQAVQWSRDGDALYTVAISTHPAVVHRVGLPGGEIEELTELRAASPSGVRNVTPVALTPDGARIVYGAERRLSDLFVVRGRW